MQRLSEEKADLYEDEVDVTTADSPEMSDIDVEEDAPPPPPAARQNKRQIPGLEPQAKRTVIRDIAPVNGTAADTIPMLGEAHPPPPPARRSSHSRRGEVPGIYDPNRGFL